MRTQKQEKRETSSCLNIQRAPIGAWKWNFHFPPRQTDRPINKPSNRQTISPFHWSVLLPTSNREKWLEGKKGEKSNTNVHVLIKWKKNCILFQNICKLFNFSARYAEYFQYANKTPIFDTGCSKNYVFSSSTHSLQGISQLMENIWSWRKNDYLIFGLVRKYAQFQLSNDMHN